jgi:prephenate dehydrogenase
VIPRRVAIIGLGLMGGSLGLALRATKDPPLVTGLDRDPRAAGAARERGAVDSTLTGLDRLDPDTEIVALAVPPAEAISLIPRWGPALPPQAALIDLSSVMMPSLAAARGVPELGGRFLGTHPICGGERSGIDAAREDLFRGATVLIGAPIPPIPTTEPGALAGRAAALWASVGGVPVSIAPELHDAVVALTSHLPYVASVALVRTIRRTGSMTRLLAQGAGPGLRDTTRIAESSVELWAEILSLNAPKLLPALELLEREIRGLRRAIEEGGPHVRALLEEARAFRREIAP